MRHSVDSIAKYFQAFRLSLLETTAFRLSFLFSFATLPLIFIVYYFLWSLAFRWNTNLQDYTFPVLISSLLTSTVIRTIIVANGVGESIESHIQRGDILVFLVRPMSYFWYQFAFQLGRIIPKLGVGTIVIAGLHLHFLQSLPSFAQAGMASLLIVLGLFMFYELYFISGIFAFWIGETWGVRNLYNHLSWLLGGATVPTIFYPELIQQVAFALPFHHSMYVPAEILLGRMGSEAFMQSTIMLAAWIAALYVAQRWMWETGLRKHDGKG